MSTINAHNNSAIPIPPKTVFFLFFLFPNIGHSPSYGLYAVHPTLYNTYSGWGAKCLRNPLRHPYWLTILKISKNRIIKMFPIAWNSFSTIDTGNNRWHKFKEATVDGIKWSGRTLILRIKSNCSLFSKMKVRSSQKLGRRGSFSKSTLPETIKYKLSSKF